MIILRDYYYTFIWFHNKIKIFCITVVTKFIITIESVYFI